MNYWYKLSGGKIVPGKGYLSKVNFIDKGGISGDGTLVVCSVSESVRDIHPPEITSVHVHDSSRYPVNKT